MFNPEFGPRHLESGPAIDEIERAEILAESERRREALIGQEISREIARDPSLEAMYSLLVESSLEWQPDKRDHLRRMIALRLRGLPEAASEAAADATFYTCVADELRAELAELEQLESLQDLSDLWDIAYEDLLHLEGGQTDQ